MRLSLLIICGLLCIAPYPVQAGLEWESQRVSFVASITDDKAEVSFAFTNTGEHPGTITSIRTSCGCTTATLDKKTYAPGPGNIGHPGTPDAPGESGEITVIFAFGDRVGKQHKRITVRTSEVGGDGGWGGARLPRFGPALALNAAAATILPT